MIFLARLAYLAWLARAQAARAALDADPPVVRHDDPETDPDAP